MVVTAPGGLAASVTRFEDLDRFRVLYPPADAAIRPLVARMLIARGVPLFGNRIETASAAIGRALVLADQATVWIISAVWWRKIWPRGVWSRSTSTRRRHWARWV